MVPEAFPCVTEFPNRARSFPLRKGRLHLWMRPNPAHADVMVGIDLRRSHRLRRNASRSCNASSDNPSSIWCPCSVKTADNNTARLSWK